MKKACNTQPCQPGENKGKLNVPDDSWKSLQPLITLPVQLEAK